MDEIKSTLMNILKEIRPDVDFEKEDALVDDEILTSFDIIAIVSEMNSEFSIAIDMDALVPENFNSVEGMTNLVKKLQEE